MLSVENATVPFKIQKDKPGQRLRDFIKCNLTIALDNIICWPVIWLYRIVLDWKTKLSFLSSIHNCYIKQKAVSKQCTDSFASNYSYASI